MNLNNAGNSFTGNGSGLTGVNAATLGGLGTTKFWQTGGNGGTTAGVNFVGTTDIQPLEVHVDGSRALRIEPGTNYIGGGLPPIPNIIGGSPGNFVVATSVGNVIAGGGEYAESSTNYITGANYNTISGGWNNHITNGYDGVIAGGENNTIGATGAAVGGGIGNVATGSSATVPGGSYNTASGANSFAAGQNAQALNDVIFVWADDSSTTPFASTANNQFLVRAGFAGINRTNPVTGSDVFAVRSPATTGYGGMYLDTAGATAQPFYGYALNGVAYAWTYLDGSDGNNWKVYNGGDQLTVTPAGNVGIGTTSPGATLDVRGNVKLGTNGQYFATGGAENLRIVRGIVEPSGAIYNGTGFTITHNSTGNYTITFSPAFADTPSLTITAYTAGSPVTANCTGGTPSGYSTVLTWVGAAQADSWWNFVAIGGR